MTTREEALVAAAKTVEHWDAEEKRLRAKETEMYNQRINARNQKNDSRAELLKLLKEMGAIE